MTTTMATVRPRRGAVHIDADTIATSVRREVGEEGEHAFVVPTVHNWVQLLYEAFGYAFPTGANHVALLGIREARYTAASEAADPGQGDFEGSRREAARGKKLKGRKRRTIDTSTVFDDLLCMVWTDSSPKKKTFARVFACTIDPGGEEAGTIGTPYLVDGRRYHVRPGKHRGKSGAGHIFSDSYGKILVLREATKGYRTFSRVRSALVAPGSGGHERWQFAAVEANPSIHMHWFYGRDEVRDQSTGCTVLKYRSWSKEYGEFKKRVGGAANKRRIPYLVLSSRYTRMYDDWCRTLKPGPKPKPLSALMTSGLREAPESLAPGRYLSSMVSSGFADAVLRLAEDLRALRETANWAIAGAEASESTADSPLRRVLLGSALDDFVRRRESSADGPLRRVLPYVDRMPPKMAAALRRWEAAATRSSPPAPADAATVAAGAETLALNLEVALEQCLFSVVG